AADKYHVPVNLLKAIGKAESNFQADVTSHCGAQGIMQLMPATAKSLGVKNAYDPEQNIMGGANYISQMLKKYDGNISLACAAYNAGSGNVAKYGGIPPFEETQNYVKKIHRYLNEGIQIPNKENKAIQISKPQTGVWKSSGNTVETNLMSNQLVSVDEGKLSHKTIEKELFDQAMEEVFTYEEYGKFLKVYFESMSMAAFSDKEDQSKTAQQAQEEWNRLTQESKYNPARMSLSPSQTEGSSL
ncbi:MAG: lytic transglycosylase domain-containing protein, partial [Lachnospiraceae bacterium]